jgi:hypothetical protein
MKQERVMALLRKRVTPNLFQSRPRRFERPVVLVQHYTAEVMAQANNSQLIMPLVYDARDWRRSNRPFAANMAKQT